MFSSGFSCGLNLTSIDFNPPPRIPRINTPASRQRRNSVPPPSALPTSAAGSFDNSRSSYATARQGSSFTNSRSSYVTASEGSSFGRSFSSSISSCSTARPPSSLSSSISTRRSVSTGSSSEKSVQRGKLFCDLPWLIYLNFSVFRRKEKIKENRPLKWHLCWSNIKGWQIFRQSRNKIW